MLVTMITVVTNVPVIAVAIIIIIPRGTTYVPIIHSVLTPCVIVFICFVYATLFNISTVALLL